MDCVKFDLDFLINEFPVLLKFVGILVECPVGFRNENPSKVKQKFKFPILVLMLVSLLWYWTITSFLSV